MNFPLQSEIENLSTLYLKNAELSKISVMRKITSNLKKVAQHLIAKIHSFQEDVRENSLSSRGEKSFYKLLGMLDPLFEILFLYYTQTRYELFSSRFPSKRELKYFNNHLTLLKRTKTKIESNQWIFILTEYQKIEQQLKKRYQQKKK